MRPDMGIIEPFSSGCWRWKNLNPKLNIFYPERGSAESWKNILIQVLRFLQPQQTLEIDYFSPTP